VGGVRGEMSLCCHGVMGGEGRGRRVINRMRHTMVTVPAHNFCAPVLAAVMAAARFMPGVCGVLVSRFPPGMTRTPLFFHSSGGWEDSDVACQR
jgi:hypothetical protein